MLKDEFNRLMSMFNDAAEGKQVNLEEVFKQALQLFQQMKQQMVTGSTEEKIEAMKLMTELYGQMMVVTKKITEKSGLTEEQLAAFAENPANFTPQQWNTIQSSKEQINRAGEDLAKTLKKTPTPGVEKKKPEGKGPQDPSQWMKP